MGLALLVVAVVLLLRPSWRGARHELALALSCPRSSCIRSSTSTGTSPRSRCPRFSLPARLQASAVPRPHVAVRGPRRGGCRRAGVRPRSSCRGSASAGRTTRSSRSPARAVQLAKRAQSVDPLLVEPLWAKAFAAKCSASRSARSPTTRRRCGSSRRTPRPGCSPAATRCRRRCFRSAYTYLERFTELNQKARPSAGRRGLQPRAAAGELRQAAAER